MNKPILFFLLCITKTSNYGMDTPKSKLNLNLDNPNLLPHITKQLCINYQYNPLQIKKDIKTLSLTNNFLHNYYHTEKIAQQIIRFCSYNLNSNDESIAEKLGCWKIKRKINHLSAITRDRNKKFTDVDLQDDWYLNCTIHSINRSLLYIAINYLNLEKAEQIIQHSKELSFRYGINQNLLLCLARHTEPNKYFISKNGNSCHKKLLFITKLLLQKKINPNIDAMGVTPLKQAAFHTNKTFAQLLLIYGADPYKKYYDVSIMLDCSAFDVEQGNPKNWLTTMFNDIKHNLFIYWSLKKHISSYIILPQELIRLITQKLNKISQKLNEV